MMTGIILKMKKQIIIDMIFNEMIICKILQYGIQWIDTVGNGEVSKDENCILSNMFYYK